MARFGKIFRGQFGKRKPREISVRKITFTKPERQVSLDVALKRANKQMEIAKKAKGANRVRQRKKALALARKILSRFD
jgi:hypothetical protein